MSNHTNKNQRNLNQQENLRSGMRIAPVIWLCLAVFYVLSLVSYSPGDNTILTNGAPGTPGNWLGDAGAWVAMFSFYTIGLASWVMAAVFMAAAVRSFFPQRSPFLPSLGGMLLILTASSILFGLQPETFAYAAEKLGIGSSNSPAFALSGGVIGQALAAPAVEGCKIFTGGNSFAVTTDLQPGFLRQWLGAVGLTIIAWVILLAGGMILHLCQWRKIIHFASFSLNLDTMISDSADRKLENDLAARLRAREEKNAPKTTVRDEEADDSENSMPAKRRNFISRLIAAQKKQAAEVPAAALPADDITFTVPSPAAEEIPSAPVPPVTAPAPDEPAVVQVQKQPPEVIQPASATFNRVPDAPDIPDDGGEKAPVKIFSRAYARPNVNMLTPGQQSSAEDSAAINDAKTRIQNTLDDFGVNGSVTGHITGPQVTRFEITLAPGVSVSKVTKLENRASDGSYDKTSGSGDEVYLIQDNPLLKGVE